MNKQEKHTKTGTENSGVVLEHDLTVGGGQAMQHTDHVSQKCILEMYMILLTDVTPINLILKRVQTWRYLHFGFNFSPNSFHLCILGPFTQSFYISSLRCR